MDHASLIGPTTAVSAETTHHSAMAPTTSSLTRLVTTVMTAVADAVDVTVPVAVAADVIALAVVDVVTVLRIRSLGTKRQLSVAPSTSTICVL